MTRRPDRGRPAPPPPLRLHIGPAAADDRRSSVPYRIGGWPARVSAWTEAEFRRLDPAPAGARRTATGLWVHLALEGGS